MIELRGIGKAYNEGRANEYWALREIDLRIEAGEATVLYGPSGSGKTTLLAVAGCLARPTCGRVFVDGQDASGLPERFQAELRRRVFGFVFQQFHLIRGMTALENVMVAAYPSAPEWGGLRRRALGLLEELEMGHRAGARVETLSGGEQQRVAIARALVNDPRVVIADEPTANLDSELAREFLEVLGRLAAEGRTILMTSHDPMVVESAVVRRVVRLRDGRIAGEGAR